MTNDNGSTIGLLITLCVMVALFAVLTGLIFMPENAGMATMVFPWMLGGVGLVIGALIWLFIRKKVSHDLASRFKRRGLFVIIILAILIFYLFRYH